MQNAARACAHFSSFFLHFSSFSVGPHAYALLRFSNSSSLQRPADASGRNAFSRENTHRPDIRSVRLGLAHGGGSSLSTHDVRVLRAFFSSVFRKLKTTRRGYWGYDRDGVSFSSPRFPALHDLAWHRDPLARRTAVVHICATLPSWARRTPGGRAMHS